MMKKVLSYGAVGLLAATLVGGTAFILLNPTEVQAQRQTAGGAGQLRETSETWQRGAGTGNGSSAIGQGQGGGRGNGGGAALSQGSFGLSQDADLSAAEIESLLYMREEEKLARDAYLTLFEQWELSIFENIANSEQQHMDAVGTLIERYGLSDPTAGNDVGQFTDPTLQALYSDLVATGSESLSDALRVGAAIEEIDILDLEEHLSQTSARDIQRVYQNLVRGSRNHLRSFVYTLEQEAGETYEPVYLDEQAFDSILSGAVEIGGYGQGQGRGAGQVGSSGAATVRGQGGSLGSSAAGRDITGLAGVQATIEWETLSGTVLLIESEVMIQTADGEVVVGMGQATFWENFDLSVGDTISVSGFYEDGEFKAGTIENVSSGETITLRDESGRPMWSGRGRLQNR